MLTKLLKAVAVLVACALGAKGADDARDIVRKSLEMDHRSERLRREYTYRLLERRVNAGEIHSKLKDVVYLAGKPYERLLEMDGKPITPEAARKEQERIDREVARIRRLLPAVLKKRTEEAIARDEKRAAFPPQVVDAFDFRVEREIETMGRQTWQIHVKSLRGAKGPGRFLPKVEGTLWIDKADAAWVRVDVTTLEPYSLLLLFFRMGAGSHLVFENMKINGELWATKRVDLTANARMALVKIAPDESESIYSDYRKFRTDSRLVDTEETH